MESKKRKHTELSDKYHALMAIENGTKKQIEISKELGVKECTVSQWVSNKAKIIKLYENGKISLTSKKCRFSKNIEVDEALLEWFKNARAKNLPITGNILSAKAEDFAALLQVDFKITNGWLHRFKKRHDIVCNFLCGESEVVNEDIVKKWQEIELPKLIENYDSKNIFNADESGLFFKARPNKSLAFKGEKCHDGKKSKDRITVLFCCNMDGGEKLRPLVIGKSASPRCLKGINKENLGVIYRSNKNSWMTAAIFTEWLNIINKHFSHQNRKIILFIDNFSGHEKNIELSNIKVVFFPANTTSKLQPLDQGIIHSFKCLYRGNLIRKQIDAFDKQEEIDDNINLKDAIDNIRISWNKISHTCILNCFNKAGFIKTTGYIIQLNKDF